MKLHHLLYLKNNIENYAEQNGATKEAALLLADFQTRFDQAYRLVDIIACGQDEVLSGVVEYFRPLYDLFREAHRARTGIELGELE